MKTNELDKLFPPRKVWKVKRCVNCASVINDSNPVNAARDGCRWCDGEDDYTD